MRLATIDLGSNTVRFLLVEVDASGGFTVLAEAQQVTRLGEGLAASGRLGEAPIARTSAVVAEYVERAIGGGADDVRIVATSAVREAVNGGAFATALAARTRARVEIASGADEARLALAGVLRGLGPMAGVVLTFDIGGGSAEYILAREMRLVTSASLGLGVVPLAERFPFPEGIEWARYRHMTGEIRARLEAELPPAIRAAPVDHLVGTAGTVTTLAALDLGLEAYDPRRVQGHVLERRAVERLLDRLGALSVAARAALPCLEPGRADLIIAGLVIVLATMDLARAEALRVSDWGLREGIVVETIEARMRARR
ncbi:MAG: Ppx/GppA family phosphatase [Candidatus Rokubacteria bacterium]|nr:Ppx/GppA family phosphatase [Candidatus Rokubacteria bacterium]